MAHLSGKAYHHNSLMGITHGKNTIYTQQYSIEIFNRTKNVANNTKHRRFALISNTSTFIRIARMIIK